MWRCANNNLLLHACEFCMSGTKACRLSRISDQKQPNSSWSLTGSYVAARRACAAWRMTSVVWGSGPAQQFPTLLRRGCAVRRICKYVAENVRLVLVVTDPMEGCAQIRHCTGDRAIHLCRIIIANAHASGCRLVPIPPHDAQDALPGKGHLAPWHRVGLLADQAATWRRHCPGVCHRPAQL